MRALITSHGSKTAQGPLCDGLAWSPAWFVVGESAYACLGKLAIANAMGAAELCAGVFGRPLAPNDYSRRHPRDLLWGEWMTQRKSDGTLIRQILDGVLQPEPGRWASWLASDEALRFCPTCLSLGFHHAACQIEGLEKCPIHGDVLRSKCAHCGAPTPRYALTRATFDAPFRCPSCWNWYGAPWKPTSKENPLSDIVSGSTYESLATWLTGLSALSLTWPNQSTWSCSSSDVERERRKSTFHALCLVSEAQVSAAILAPSHQVCILGALLTSQPLNFERSLIRHQRQMLLYRALRRWLWHTLGFGDDSSKRSYVTRWLEEHEDGSMLIPPGDEPPEISAFMLWRQRFEETLGALSSDSPTVLRGRMATWPVDVIASLDTWVRFCAMSFLADYAVCVQWQKRLTTLDSTGPGNPRWVELVNEFRPKLNSSNPPWPCHLSYAYQSATPSTATPQIWIFVCAGEGYNEWIHQASRILAAIPSVAARLSKRHECVNYETASRQTNEGNGNTTATTRLNRPQHLTDLRPSTELDGHDGVFRAPEGPSMPLQNDLQAINAWLDTFRDQPAAASSYRRALEKIVNWAYVQRGKAMSSLDRGDFDAFESFLLNPSPRTLWIMGSGSGGEWAPFRGPLAPASIRSTMIAIRLLYEWLSNIRYATNRFEIRPYRIGPLADANPMTAGTNRKIRSEPISGSAMSYLWRAIENDDTREGLRRQLVISLCYYGTLSLPEVQALSGDDIARHPTVLKVQRRKPGCQIVYVVPPLGELLRQWIDLTGVKTASDDLWTTRESSSEPLLGMGLVGIQQIARHVFRDAASLATIASDAHTAELLLNAGARRLANTFLQQVEDAGGDNWRLFGRAYNIPSSTLAYLGPRSKLSPEDLSANLDRISHLWRQR